MRNRGISAAARKSAGAHLRFLALSMWLFAGVVPLARAAEIAIVQPAAEQTVHSNAGDVRVVVRASDAVPGSRMRLIVDGSAWPGEAEGEAITLTGLDRGTHAIQAELVGADGTVLATSRPVTFYVWQASRLFRHRTP